MPLLFVLSAALNPASATTHVYWAAFTNRGTIDVVLNELHKAPGSDIREIDIPIDPDQHPNPFKSVSEDFDVGQYLPDPGQTPSAPPSLEPRDAEWFEDRVSRDELPQIFVIGGHQVISEGWHNHAETRFMFLPTLLQTLQSTPAAREVFGSVKLAILWGCNAMTNLEPHGPAGEYLDPGQIRLRYESGLQGRKTRIGSEARTNSLEFYKARLALEYGPNSPTGHYEYTRNVNDERCLGPGRYERCSITNLERIMPESGLFDGSHRYNYPYMMKRLFPGAYLVLGFSSASPSESERTLIFQEIPEARRECKRTVRCL